MTRFSPASLPWGRRPAALVLAALAGLAVGAATWVGGLSQRVEDALALHVLEGARPPARDPGLVRVVIDDLADQPWPWPKLDYAILLHALAPYEPEVLALDWPLDLPDVEPGVYERQLARQMKAFRGIVLAARPWQASVGSAPLLEPIPTEGSLRHIPRLQGASWPAVGSADVRVSPLAVTSGPRVPLLLRYENRVIPAFPLAVYGKWLGAYWPHCTARPGRDITLRDYQNQRLARIPVDASGALRPIPASRLPEVPRVEFYSAILSAEQMHQQQEPLFDLNRLRRCLVLATVEHPAAASPGTDGLFPGEHTAHALLQLMTRSHWEPAPLPGAAAILVAVAVLMAWAGSLQSCLHAGTALGGGLLFLAADTWFFLRFFDVQLPWVAAAAAGLTAWALASAATARPDNNATVSPGAADSAPRVQSPK